MIGDNSKSRQSEDPKSMEAPGWRKGQTQLTQVSAVLLIQVWFLMGDRFFNQYGKRDNGKKKGKKVRQKGGKGKAHFFKALRPCKGEFLITKAQ